jgi:large subunit ribosomal protein L6
MSRIGKLPVAIPAGVTITVDPDNVVVTGPKGTLTQFIVPNVTVRVEGSEFVVTRNDESKAARSCHGLMRALVANMVEGVTKGFKRELEVNGVGFRVAGGGRALELALGYSHPVKFQAPEGVNLTVDKMNITVEGADKQLVGQVAADIRKLRAPEPYKGKGIKYVDEQVRHKAGKAGK